MVGLFGGAILCAWPYGWVGREDAVHAPFSPPGIPTGFRNIAQGCGVAPLPWGQEHVFFFFNPKGVAYVFCRG